MLATSCGNGNHIDDAVAEIDLAQIRRHVCDSRGLLYLRQRGRHKSLRASAGLPVRSRCDSVRMRNGMTTTTPGRDCFFLGPLGIKSIITVAVESSLVGCRISNSGYLRADLVLAKNQIEERLFRI